MFLETTVALIPVESQKQSELNELLGKNVFEQEEYEYRKIRILIDQISMYYESNVDGCIVIKLIDYDHCMLIKDDIRRIDAIINEGL